ncbi:MAG: hypothetical protein ACOYW4_08660 [Bacillota bacterium]
MFHVERKGRASFPHLGGSITVVDYLLGKVDTLSQAPYTERRDVCSRLACQQWGRMRS